MLSDVDDTNIKERYEKGVFIPNSFGRFILSKEKYDILLKATSYDRNERFESIKAFHQEWNRIEVK